MTSPPESVEDLPDIRDVLGALGAEVIEINDYSKRGNSMDDKIKGRLAALEQEKAAKAGEHARIVETVKALEESKLQVWSRICGLNGAIEELTKLVDMPEPEGDEDDSAT